MDLNYEKAKKNAAHLRALGNCNVYLSRGELEDMPWHVATSCEPGGTHRLDMATSVWFSGQEDGLQYRWSFDIEPIRSNGASSYQIDVPACKRVMGLLKGDARTQFRDYIAACVEKVQARSEEFQKAADKQRHDAAALRDILSA